MAKRFIFQEGESIEDAKIYDSLREVSYDIYELGFLTALLNELNEKGD